MSYYEIGVILKPQGLKGVVKVKPFTDFLKERFSKGSIVYLEQNNQKVKYTVSSYRLTKGDVYIAFEGYEDINKIEAWRGQTIFVHEDHIHALKDSEYYIRDLLGMKVFQETIEVGEVSDVYTYTNDDILVVKRKGLKNALIPLREEFIETVDLKNKKVVIKAVEGLL